MLLALATLAAIVILALIFGGFTARVAEAKGYSYGAWFCGGALTGFVALIAIAGMPMREIAKERPPEDERHSRYEVVNRRMRERAEERTPTR